MSFPSVVKVKSLQLEIARIACLPARPIKDTRNLSHYIIKHHGTYIHKTLKHNIDENTGTDEDGELCLH